MIITCNDATGRMIEAFKANNGKETLANIALMWADFYDLKMKDDDDTEKGQYAATGLYILTKFVQHLNERDN